MKEVELKLVTNNQQAVQGVRELAKESEKLYSNSEKQQKRQVGLIADIEKELGRLQTAQKNAMSLEQITKYNQKIAEAKRELKEYNEAGIKVEKTSASILQTFGKWVIGLASVSAAMKLFKEVIASTEASAKALEIIIAEATSGVGYFFKAIASGDWTNFREGLTSAMNGARQFVLEMEDIENRRNEQLILSAEATKKIAKLRIDTFDKGEENTDKLITNLRQIIEIQKTDYVNQAKIAKDAYETSLKKASTDNKIAKDRLDFLVSEYTVNRENIELGEKYNVLQVRLAAARKVQNNKERIELIKSEIAALGENAIAAGKLAMEYGKVPQETKNQLAQLKATQIALEGQAEIGSRRDENQLAAALNRKKKEEEDAAKDTNKAKQKWFKDYDDWFLDNLNKQHSLALKLVEDYDRSNIESLKGVEKLKAQRDYGLKQIAEMRSTLSNLGTLTPEQEEMFKMLGKNVWDFYMDGMEKEAKESPEQKEAISKALLEGLPKLEGLRGIYQTPTQKKNSFWTLLGIDPESDEGKQQMQAMKEAANTVMSVMDQVYQKRVEEAQRRRELLDTQISELQSQIETETELYKAGYASNVAEKQRELDQLKAKRDKALKEEETTIKNQQRLNTISQISSLTTAVANIFSSDSKKGTAGIIIAIAGVAAMLASFIASKSSIESSVRLAGGGHGTVSGRLHSQGGERFLDHVEIEQGERWGVLSRAASRKYGPQFDKIVDSFNRDKLPIPKGAINNILVQNDGPNRRLDEVNSNLRQIKTKEDIIVLNGMTIYKKGSNVRIVKK